MERLVQPELLDSLPEEDPLARGSRDDLRRLNTWMGNARILARQLQQNSHEPKPWRILDLGAGDGQFMWQVARRLPELRNGTTLALLDKQPAVSAAAWHGLESLGWKIHLVRAEVRQWLTNSTDDPWSAICCNLFLHHFSERELQHMLKLISERTPTFVAVEPRRSPWALIGSKMVGVIGCNRVTRHDAVISVRAGFSGNALSLLWPKDSGWVLQERAAGLFSHLFVARARRKTETRNPDPKAEGNSKSEPRENPKSVSIRISGFGLASEFDLRASDSAAL